MPMIIAISAAKMDTSILFGIAFTTCMVATYAEEQLHVFSPIPVMLFIVRETVARKTADEIRCIEPFYRKT